MRQTVANILRETAEAHRIAILDLVGPNRRKYIAWPRQEAMFRIFTDCPHLSLAEIGRRLGGRDHSTIWAGVIRHCERNGMTYAEAKVLREGGIDSLSFAEAATAFGNVMERARHAC